jgi:Rrf2 family protein
MTSVLRRDTDHGIRLLLSLAEAGGSRFVTVRELAATAGVPVALAHKLAQRLRDAGVLACRRGVAGGVMLRADPRRISVLDLVEAIQGPLGLCGCMVDENACARRSYCRLSSSLRGLQAELTALFQKTTLADMLAPPGNGPAAKASPGRSPGRRKGKA